MTAVQSRATLRGRSQTVAGVIDPAALGATLLHEHVLCDIRPPSWPGLDTPNGQVGLDIPIEDRFAIDYGEIQAPGNLLLNQTDVAIRELSKLPAVGGTTVVDLSCGGLHPNPRGLAQIAAAADVNIVMGCGHYVEEYQDPVNQQRTVDSFTREMLDQLFVGAWGTDIRAGIIGEIGCQAPWTALERRVMAAAVQAQAESGAALTVHPGRHPDQPQEIVDFLRGERADLSRVIISHIDRTIFDDDRLFRLADSGVVIELDLFGMETSFYKWSDIDMPNDAQRLKMLRKLIDRGHLTQIAISHDICYRSRLACNGGHGYGHIFRNVVPMMLRRGFDQSEIDSILRVTPRRLLTFV